MFYASENIIQERKMNQDLQKYYELLQTDTTLQEKMKAAAEQYTGEQTQESIFENLIAPAAKEAGCNFTWDDFRQYAEQNVQQLDTDEMDQVVAGSDNKGAGATACLGIGLGLGGALVESGLSKLFGACLGIGIGGGSVACMGDGVGAEP